MSNYERGIWSAAWALIVSGVAVILILCINPMGANAATVKPSVNWTQRACTAFAAYQAHPSSAKLDALVTDSLNLGKGYLKADVGQLYADASSPSPKAVTYLAKDKTYVSEDCAS